MRITYGCNRKTKIKGNGWGIVYFIRSQLKSASWIVIGVFLMGFPKLIRVLGFDHSFEWDVIETQINLSAFFGYMDDKWPAWMDQKWMVLMEPSILTHVAFLFETWRPFWSWNHFSNQALKAFEIMTASQMYKPLITYKTIVILHNNNNNLNHIQTHLFEAFIAFMKASAFLKSPKVLTRRQQWVGPVRPSSQSDI